MKKSVFASAGLVFLLTALLFGRFCASVFAPPEDLPGYGGLAAALIGIAAFLLLGFISGCISLFHNELPKMFASFNQLSKIFLIASHA